MENLIYILAPIALFLFKAYQNFQKEQEKARKRNLSIPEQPEITVKDEVQTQPMIEERTEATELKPDYKLSKPEKYEKEQYERMVYERLRSTDKKPADYYNPEIPSAEVIENRAIHEKHKHGISQPKKEEQESYDFDLRQAVINEAILKRPY
ncbi:hypothetical protein [Pedobacter puniceum]|jgi:hypothetical protein|uniref:Uncharacterized protein n=1 Tax=Pedobacter puniceum TaxID=2666136 RepID=A0A7K0FKU7_9SPHI|nr:hypothetical protein [Pedobacter puniceum]MRX46422.1 hypothetical protein [Pedobacter puniceum]